MTVTTRRPPVEYPEHIAALINMSAAEIMRGCKPPANAATYAAQAKPALDNAPDSLSLGAQIVRYSAEALRGRGWSESTIERELAAHGVAFLHPLQETASERSIVDLARDYVERACTVERLFGAYEAMMPDGVTLDEVFDVVEMRRQIRGMIVQTVAQVYSAAELEAALAWMSTDIGRSFQAKSDDVEQRTKAAMAPIVDACKR